MIGTSAVSIKTRVEQQLSVVEHPLNTTPDGACIELQVQVMLKTRKLEQTHIPHGDFEATQDRVGRSSPVRFGLEQAMIRFRGATPELVNSCAV
jgi:hypothetical protein